MKAGGRWPMACGGSGQIARGMRRMTENAYPTGRQALHRRFATRRLRTAGFAFLLVLAVPVHAQTPGSAPAAETPEQVVTRYLTALKAEKFGEAWDCLTSGMAQGKTRDAWAKEQQWQLQMSEAKIFDFHVYPGKIEGDKAKVPNLLSSQDKFLNQLGVPEHELYSLVRQDGRWKIDQQQLLEHTEQAPWFPNPKATP